MDSPLSSLPEFEYSFKLLIIGDSGVGKSGLLLRFTLDSFEESAPTIGVDFKLKKVTIGDKKLQLQIWDTAGQERFRTLTSSYYRGAQGIIMVYDVTRKGTFTNLADVWAKEIDLYSTNRDCIKMLVVVGNKIDKESARDVTMKEGIDFAREYGCLFLECSVKTGDNVKRCFEELVSKAASRSFYGKNQRKMMRLQAAVVDNCLLRWNLTPEADGSRAATGVYGGKAKFYKKKRSYSNRLFGDDDRR